MQKLYAVIGFPVHHSKSPEIYNYLFKKHGINSTYISIELREDNAEEFLNEFAAPMNLAGINVTMPLKGIAADYAYELDPVSKLLRSVNTLDLRRGMGYTTDGKGFLLSLGYQGIDIKGKNIVVLGAGGAAKSIIYELSNNKPASLMVLNRTITRARELAQTIGGMMGIDIINNIDEYMPKCDILINCTSMGMTGRETIPISFLKDLKEGAFVYDIVYEPRQTELLKRAAELGHPTSNGLDMLICQAFYAFNIFTGIFPDKTDRDILLKIL